MRHLLLIHNHLLLRHGHLLGLCDIRGQPSLRLSEPRPRLLNLRDGPLREQRLVAIQRPAGDRQLGLFRVQRRRHRAHLSLTGDNIPRDGILLLRQHGFGL